MNPLPEWFWIGVLALGPVTLVGVRIYAARSRRKAFRSAAVAIGLDAFPKTRPIPRRTSKKFNLFSRGNSGRGINICSDQIVSRLLFDFRYVFGIPLIASRRYAQTVAAFSVGIAGLPDFQLTPATRLDRVAPKLGFKAIRSDRRPEFNKRYWLRSDEDFRVSALFTDQLIDHLASIDLRAEYSIEKGGDWLILYRHGVLTSPASLADFWRSAERLAALFVRLKDTQV
jgi:hypothetical protein